MAAIQETGKPLDKQADVLTDLQGLIRATQGPSESPSSNGADVNACHNGYDDASSSADYRYAAERLTLFSRPLEPWVCQLSDR
mgnify:CR=1 FL=1